MAYAFRYLTAAEVKAAKPVPPGPVVPDTSVLRAWELDLAAHLALVSSATGADKDRHKDSITALEAALTAAPTPKAPPTP